MTPGPTTTTARAATVGTEKGEVHRRCSSDQPREATFDLRPCWSKVSFTLHDLEQARTGDRTASLLRGQDMEGAGWGRMPSDKTGDGGSERAVPQLLPSYLLYAMLAVTLVVLTSSELLSSEGEGLPSRLLLRRSTASAVRAAGNPANNADRNAVQPGKLSLPPVVIASADNDNTYFMASPSITKLPDGSLLAVGLRAIYDVASGVVTPPGVNCTSRCLCTIVLPSARAGSCSVESHPRDSHVVCAGL